MCMVMTMSMVVTVTMIVAAVLMTWLHYSCNRIAKLLNGSLECRL